MIEQDGDDLTLPDISALPTAPPPVPAPEPPPPTRRTVRRPHRRRIRLWWVLALALAANGAACASVALVAAGQPSTAIAALTVGLLFVFVLVVGSMVLALLGRGR